jgi:hypothetical protein
VVVKLSVLPGTGETDPKGFEKVTLGTTPATLAIIWFPPRRATAAAARRALLRAGSDRESDASHNTPYPAGAAWIGSTAFTTEFWYTTPNLELKKVTCVAVARIKTAVSRALNKAWIAKTLKITPRLVKNSTFFPVYDDPNPPHHLPLSISHGTDDSVWRLGEAPGV